jgi:hypothetical protein
VPVLTVKGFSGTYVLSAEAKAGDGQRGSLATVAAQYGLPFHIPTEAELSAWGVTGSGFPTPRTEPQEWRALVAGTLSFDGHQRRELRRSVPLPDARRRPHRLGARRAGLRRWRDARRIRAPFLTVEL